MCNMPLFCECLTAFSLMNQFEQIHYPGSVNKQHFKNVGIPGWNCLNILQVFVGYQANFS